MCQQQICPIHTITISGETLLFETILGQSGRFENDGSFNEESHVGRSQLSTLTEQTDSSGRPTVASHTPGQSVRCV